MTRADKDYWVTVKVPQSAVSKPGYVFRVAVPESVIGGSVIGTWVTVSKICRLMSGIVNVSNTDEEQTMSITSGN